MTAPQQSKDNAMDKQHVKGAANKAIGKVQKKTGQALDDRSMQAKGAAREVAGKAQQKVGDAKDAVRDEVRREERTEDKALRRDLDRR
jgi:uncharacterized protein YjbJ (UPF0337 family)